MSFDSMEEKNYVLIDDDEKEILDINEKPMTNEEYINKINDIINSYNEKENFLENELKNKINFDSDNVLKVFENIHKNIESNIELILNNFSDKDEFMNYKLSKILKTYENIYEYNKKIQSSFISKINALNEFFKDNNIFDNTIEDFFIENENLLSNSDIFLNFKTIPYENNLIENIENEDFRLFILENLNFESLSIENKNDMFSKKIILKKNKLDLVNLELNNIQDKLLSNLFDLNDNSFNNNDEKKINNDSSNISDEKKQINLSDDKGKNRKSHSLDSSNVESKSSKELKNINDIKDKNQQENNSYNIHKMNWIQFPNLKKIIINNGKIIGFNFFNIGPNINTIKIYDCPNYNFIFPENNILNLKNISLDGIDLITETFETFFIQIILNQSIINNLEILSLKNNKIGIIDITSILKREEINNNITDKEKIIFSNLKELHFANNMIYCFKTFNKNIMPSIQLINLSGNNFSYSGDYDDLRDITLKDKVYLFFSKNYFLTKQPIKNNYIKDLCIKLKQNKYKLKQLNLDYLFVKQEENLILFNELDLTNIQISLINLNFSYCNLTDEKIINFLFKFPLPNLENLNLSGNYLTNQFFNLYIQNKEKTNISLKLIMTNLKSLNISSNEKINIEGENANIIMSFVSVTKINKLYIYHTKFENTVIENLRTMGKNFVIQKQKESNRNISMSLSNISINTNVNPNFERFFDFIETLKIKIFIRYIPPSKSKNYKKYMLSVSENFEIL